MLPLIGATLDKYEVLQKVGEGGMATVYRGRHCTLDRHVAIKVLHPHLSSSTRNRKRFAREARAIEHLRHENILEIFDYSGLDASDCYIITEFVEGDTLTKLLQSRGCLPSEVVAIVGLKLAKALSYAHEMGILHRDLKPDNVMLRNDGTVKLMDFGIARFLDESQVTMTGALVGSPAFMSPEQAREGDLDHRSDLFSLGTMMFYLVTGALPFSGSNPSLILKNVIEANRPSVAEVASTISARLGDVIERLMATNADDRFNTASDVVDALQAVLAESNVDPAEEQWTLRTYLEDPEAYETRLFAHLSQVLLLRGKERLGAADHLAALRLFNRLLALDEDNEEVLELVQNLHGERAGQVGGKALLVLALVLAILGGAAYAWVYYDRSQRVIEAVTPAVPVEASAVVTPEAPPVEIAPQPLARPVPDTPTPETAPQPMPRERATPRVVRPEPEPLPTDEPSERAQVRIRVTNNQWGNVYVDGRNVGRTTDGVPLQLTPGAHVLQVKGPRIVTWEQQVEVSSGEVKEVAVALVPRPGTIAFDGWMPLCEVLFDGAPQGTIASLQGRLAVEQAADPHTVHLRCPDGTEKEQTFAFVDGTVQFPAPD